MEINLYPIKKSGFTIYEVMLSMTLFILILGICVALLGVVFEAGSEKTLERDGQKHYRAPSMLAFTKAINLNHAFIQKLAEADLAIVCKWQGRGDIVLPENSIIIHSSQAFIKKFPDLASVMDENASNVVLFKNHKIIGILGMEMQYEENRAFGKIAFIKGDEKYDYGVYFEGISDSKIFGIKNIIKGYREELNIECERIELNLPNPMAIGEERASSRFSYAFTCRR